MEKKRLIWAGVFYFELIPQHHVGTAEVGRADRHTLLTLGTRTDKIYDIGGRNHWLGDCKVEFCDGDKGGFGQRTGDEAVVTADT